MKSPFPRSQRLALATLAGSALALGGVLGALHAGQASGSASLDLKRDDHPVARSQLEPSSYADVVSKVSPSVVKIVVDTKAKQVSAEEAFPGFNDPFFRQFFGNGAPQLRQEPVTGLGSGVIISSDGFIATNNHVVDGADRLTVTLSDGREFSAHVVGRDPLTDIAVVRIDAHGLPAITFADSDKIRIGDRVLAIGNPLGIGETVTSGIVSATRRNIGLLQDVKGYEDFIQTDAAINPGNSGGALVDVEGRLIGINTAIVSRSGGFQGIGLAVPSDMVSRVAEGLVKNGKVERGYIGINIQNVTPDLQDSFKLGSLKGALVAEVSPGTPAARAGLKDGDVVTELNGKPVLDANELALAVSEEPPGSKLDLGLMRDGRSLHVSVKTEQRPGAKASHDEAYAADDDQGVLNGVTVDDLNGETRQQMNLPDHLKGALVTQVDPDSAAARAGVSAGDVILSINRHRVESAQQAVDLSAKAENKKTLLRLWSHGSTLFVVVDESQADKSAS